MYNVFMQIKKVVPSGYCKGVMNAINLAKKAHKENPNENIYVLGMIVHNKYVTKALEQYNIKTLIGDKAELIEQINEGIVIFSAHGISEQIKNRAIEKGLKFVDASCIDVIRTQNNIKKYLAAGYKVLYIGKLNHPEAEAVLSISQDIQLITKNQDILDSPFTGKIYVTNQTTMSIFEVAHYFEKIKEKYPDAIIEREICHATSSRQEAILKLNECDLLYIVGDPKSNNTNKLKEIGCWWNRS